MDRREFFKRGISKVADTAVKNLDAKASTRAQRWIRPPYAKTELEFLLACTRCNACIDACPHKIIFPLAEKNGVQVMNTPALDLLNAGCHLCSDWPCVTACETQALFLPKQESAAALSTELPRLAKAVIDMQNCLPYHGPECGACASACTVEGALKWQAERPTIDLTFCTGCALCREYCITEPKAILISSL
ncbi:Iron-sulfur cluster-binding protein [hydrothermal vent metagenome]|uniref:Iron-sulfur cluster-binding protein n=1 Tax=hydrothermal vent metagenome TaxID=652676 RepID=A0A3B1ADD9_9ZZZZ